MLVAGLADAGVYRGLQTLRQLLVPSTSDASSSAGGCAVAPVTIEDWPDTPYRGLFMYGNGFYNDNATFLADVIDRMARHKLSYAVFDGDGGKHFFQAMADPHGPIAGN